MVGLRSSSSSSMARTWRDGQQQRQLSSGSSVGRSMAGRRRVAATKVSGGKHAAFPWLVGTAVGGGVWQVASSVLVLPHPTALARQHRRYACISARIASSCVGTINPISGVSLEQGLGMLVGRPLSNCTPGFSRVERRLRHVAQSIWQRTAWSRKENCHHNRARRAQNGGRQMCALCLTPAALGLDAGSATYVVSVVGFTRRKHAPFCPTSQVNVTYTSPYHLIYSPHASPLLCTLWMREERGHISTRIQIGSG